MSKNRSTWFKYEYDPLRSVRNKMEMNDIGMPKYNSFIWKIHPHSNADGVFSSQIRLVTSTYSRNSALLLLQIFFAKEGL